MQIFVNGEQHRLDSPLLLNTLLQQLGYNGDTFAVAVNGDFVSRANYAETTIHDGSRLDVVAPVVGG